MKRKSMIPLALLLMTATACSSKSSSTSTTTTSSSSNSGTSSYSFQVTTPTDYSTDNTDSTSSATVLDEETGYGNSSYEIFYLNSSTDELLLEGYPSVDYLVFQALSTPYLFDSNVPIDVIHQTVKESLGDRYDAVRSNYNLLTRDAYYQALASTDDPVGLKNLYSKDLSDLPEKWFQGLTSTEIAYLKDIVLDYYNINDLLKSTHYSGISGIEPLINFAITMSAVDSHIQTLSAGEQETTRALVNRVIYQSDQVSSSEYITMVTPKLTVRELLEVVVSMEDDLTGPLLQDEKNLFPERIGYYASSRHYGMSTIESLSPSVSGNVYGNVTETVSDSNVSSKTARLYLPQIGTDDYYVLTIQELIFDATHIYTYLNVETASISTFNTSMAQDLHKNNVVSLCLQYGLEVDTTGTGTTEDLVEQVEDEDELEVDDMSSATPEMVTISTKNGAGEVIEVTIPHFPERVVLMDYVSFDVLSCLGVQDRFERLLIQDELPGLLQTYLLGDENLSATVGVGDLTAVEAFQPEVIFANAQSAWIYDALSAIAPVIMIDLDDGDAYGSFLKNVATISSVFSIQDEADAVTVGYDQRLESLRNKASGQTAVIASVRDGVMTVENQYATLILQELGLDNVAAHLVGEQISSDTVAELAPDYLFVLNHDGSFTPVDTKTVFLDVPSWTLLDGGLLGMNQMLSDLEQGIS